MSRRVRSDRPGLTPGQWKWGLRASSLAAVAAVWEVAGRSLHSLLLPSFSDTVVALARLLVQASTWQAIWLSNQALIAGFLLAVVVGMPLGLALGASQRAARFADVYLNTLLVIPIAALIPLFILATGLTLTSRAIVVFVFSFVIIAINTEAGLRQVDPALVEMARSFGADRAQLWRKVLLPGALPVILGGVRLGLGRAIAGMVVVELLLVAVGFGRLIVRFQGDFEAAYVYAVVLIVIAEALLLLWLVQALQRRWVRWGEEAVVE